MLSSPAEELVKSLCCSFLEHEGSLKLRCVMYDCHYPTMKYKNWYVIVNVINQIEISLLMSIFV